MLSPGLAHERLLLNPLMPLERHVNPRGAAVLRIHYKADPSKQSREWFAHASADVPRNEWLREMEGDISAVDGMPVFPEYRDDWHCPEPARSSFIAVHPEAHLIGGWDCSTSTINIAFVLYQIIPPLNQVQAVIEVIGQPGEPMETVAPRVAAVIAPLIKGARVWHVGDPMGAARQGATGETAFQCAYRTSGIAIAPSTNSWAERQSAMAWMLLGSLGDEDQFPRFVISGRGCPIYRSALGGNYKWREQKLDNRSVIREPLKNSYSHIADAGQYAAIHARKLINAVPDHSPKKVKRAALPRY